MKKKKYILPKLKAVDVADPIANFYRDEDERLLAKYIEEDSKEEKVVKNKKHRKTPL